MRVLIRIVNLHRRPERLQRTLRILRDALPPDSPGISFTVKPFAAVDGEQLSLDVLASTLRASRSHHPGDGIRHSYHRGADPSFDCDFAAYACRLPTKGDVGCTRSDVQLWNDSANCTDYDFVLVLEDDITSFSADALLQCLNQLQDVPPNQPWHLCYLFRDTRVVSPLALHYLNDVPLQLQTIRARQVHVNRVHTYSWSTAAYVGTPVPDALDCNGIELYGELTIDSLDFNSHHVVMIDLIE